MMTQAECKPMRDDVHFTCTTKRYSRTLLHRALHGIVYKRPEYEPQTQMSS